MGEVLPPTVVGRRVHPAQARTEWQTARTRTGDSTRTRPHHTAGLRNTEVLAAGLVHVSLSPPPAQRPSRPLRRGRGGGRLTPARQGGWTEPTWRQTWGLERNEIYPHPAVLPPRSHPVLPSVRGWVKVAAGGGGQVWARRRSGRLFLLYIPSPRLPGSPTPPPKVQHFKHLHLPAVLPNIPS